MEREVQPFMAIDWPDIQMTWDISTYWYSCLGALCTSLVRFDHPDQRVRPPLPPASAGSLSPRAGEPSGSLVRAGATWRDRMDYSADVLTEEEMRWATSPYANFTGGAHGANGEHSALPSASTTVPQPEQSNASLAPGSSWFTR